MASYTPAGNFSSKALCSNGKRGARWQLLLELVVACLLGPLHLEHLRHNPLCELGALSVETVYIFDPGLFVAAHCATCQASGPW